ncbi:bacteriocin [Aeromonas enteropelogenes]|uniref:bacteriocin n=1 Tax=Aeromonas enteropelogenes TaxID=29489 RepID=UPI0038D22E2D
MGYGLIDIGAQTRRQALQGLQESAQLDDQREAMNKRLRSQQRGQTMTNIGTGAAVGTMVMPGIGTVIGAGLGALASLF